MSVDDLLDGERPVRSLTRVDVQSLLSFVFALGGGALFYLLKLFVPVPVCYLAYLGCMAYGVYLQRYYSYRSRWFWLGNAGMNLAVNLSLLSWVAMTGAWLVSGSGVALAAWLQSRMMGGKRWQALGLLLVWLAAVAAVTALTMALARRKDWRGTRLSWSLPRGRALVPAAGLLAVLAFWGTYRMELPGVWYWYQEELFAALLLLLAALYLWLFRKQGQRWRMVPALFMTALCVPMLGLRTADWMVSRLNGKRYHYLMGGSLERFIVAWEPKDTVFLLGLVLLALYLVLAGLSFQSEKEE